MHDVEKFIFFDQRVSQLSFKFERHQFEIEKSCENQKNFIVILDRKTFSYDNMIMIFVELHNSVVFFFIFISFLK